MLKHYYARYARVLYLLGVVAALVVASGADRKFD